MQNETNTLTSTTSQYSIHYGFKYHDHHCKTKLKCKRAKVLKNHNKLNFTKNQYKLKTINFLVQEHKMSKPLCLLKFQLLETSQDSTFLTN